MVKIGLEIHQQLDTHKLFCSCASDLKEQVYKTITRTLRAAFGETGKIDLAALEEMQRGRVFEYELTDNTCLVEIDEEPPHPVNLEALNIALSIALLLNCQIVDEIHFMRKIVVDGSNTTGFQRTALIGVNGYIDTDYGRIHIPTVCLEEEAARKIREIDQTVTYRLDRLGIPLVEIATAPELVSGTQVKEVAQAIGYLLRATKNVKRGVGTIRQDLNISTTGERVEIKGVSQLKLIPKIVNNEIKRQLMLTRLKEELVKRKAQLKNLKIEDISTIFHNTASKIIRRCINHGGKVYAVHVPKFATLLKSEKFQLGRELADHVKRLGINGIFHTDELPGYGITEKEVVQVKNKFKSNVDDAIIILCGSESKALVAIDHIITRLNMAFKGVVGETRAPKDDASTTFLRVLPGRERMYPETDIPPISITDNMIETIKSKLPEKFDQKVQRFMQQYRLSKQEARQLLLEMKDELFELLATSSDQYSIIARTILNTFAELKSEGLNVQHITEHDLITLFKALNARKFAKEAIPEILKTAIIENKRVKTIINEQHYKTLNEAQLKKEIQNLIIEKRTFILDKKTHAFAPLMGIIMAKFRGKYDGKKISDLLKTELDKFLKTLK